MLWTALASVPAHAQVMPQEPFVVGQGSFSGGGGWLAYRGDRPDLELRRWTQLPWPAYNVSGGAVHPAIGDVDGDGRDEIVLGLGTGGYGWIAVLDDRDHGNALLTWLQVPYPAYNATDGSIFPAVGDLDGDGRAEIAAGLGRTGEGLIAIYDDAASGFAFLGWRQVAWPAYTAGDGRVHVAIGDLAGDGASEIIVGLGPGGAGWIEIFRDAAGGYQHQAWLQLPWPAYNSTNGTVFPAAGDLDGDGRDEIVAGLGTGSNGWLAVFDDGQAGFAHRSWKQLAWVDYNANAGESHPATANVDGDAAAEVIVGLAAYTGNGGWFAILDDLDANLAHVAWRNLDWPAFRVGGGATFPAGSNRQAATLLQPANGAQWQSGKAQSISWIADASIGAVVLEYSLDNGATWESIATVSGATGSYPWSVPNFASRFMRLRIADAADRRPLSAVKTIVVVRGSSALWQRVTPSAAWNPRDGVGALVFGGRMWQLGGWHWDTQTYPNVASEIWSSTDGLDWRYDGLAPWSNHVGGSVVFNGKMWIVGGYGNPDVWSSANGINWTRVLTNGPFGPRYKPYVVVHGGKIWLMGGFDLTNFSYTPLNDVWSSPDGVNWTRVLEHAPWAPRGAMHGEVVFDGKIWLIGGGQYTHFMSDTEHYFNDVWTTSDGVSWTLVTGRAPWPARLHQNVAVYADRLWLLAGHNGRDLFAGAPTLLNDVWVSSDGANWTEIPDAPWSPRHAAATYAFDGDFYLAAGFLVNDVWKFHLAGNIEIDEGASTTASTAVMLALAPPDPSVDAMQFSNDGTAWSNAEPYARTKAWTLPAGAGSKTVYVRFRRGGTWTQPFSDSIAYTGS